uniref:Putative secreted protein n=1 Tax=Anopheles marajoara TaxID=58244 RepID=A0A2M4C8M4_9DIPT
MHRFLALLLLACLAACLPATNLALRGSVSCKTLNHITLAQQHPVHGSCSELITLHRTGVAAAAVDRQTHTHASKDTRGSSSPLCHRSRIAGKMCWCLQKNK